MASAAPAKPVHTLILDAGPIISNTPPISTLLSQATTLLTTPTVISEIRDAAARARFETTWKPFVEVRSPNAESRKFTADFARKTGDFAVLSRADMELLALAYEVECERNSGDWRLRRVPGQKGLNGTPPEKKEEAGSEVVEEPGADRKQELNQDDANQDDANTTEEGPKVVTSESLSEGGVILPTDGVDDITTDLSKARMSNGPESQHDAGGIDTQESSSKMSLPPPHGASQQEQEESDSDSEGWITPSNLRKQQIADTTSKSNPQNTSKMPTTLQAALTTTDHALQNTALILNLNLLSPTTLTRIRHLKSHILRCHACFRTCRFMDKQFCPNCGKPTLTRVTCSTDANTGEFKLHLKKNMQWNNRGEKFSIPKPVAGRSNGKIVDGQGGKGGWGQRLVLAEDQKEYLKAVEGSKRERKKDLLDEDVLPSILSGDRGSGGRSGGRMKVGASKNINATKRR